MFTMFATNTLENPDAACWILYHHFIVDRPLKGLKCLNFITYMLQRETKRQACHSCTFYLFTTVEFYHNKTLKAWVKMHKHFQPYIHRYFCTVPGFLIDY